MNENINRRDSSGAKLKMGEVQRKNGLYQFAWRDEYGKKRYVYANTLPELRQKEAMVSRDKAEGIRAAGRFTTVDELFDRWCELKRGIKNNTFENYKYSYNSFVKAKLGNRKISDVRKSEIKALYNYLLDDRYLKVTTIEGVQNVLHQMFELAVDDDLVRHNPTNNALGEFKRARGINVSKKKGLTKAEQDLFLSYTREHPTFSHWYPILAVLIGTGMRIGELIGLRWCDVDFENGFIDVNHSVSYYMHSDPKSRTGTYHEAHSTKTEAGERKIPIFGFVKEALMMEKELQRISDIKCNTSVDGYTDFVFLNQWGRVYNPGSINRAIKRICRDCNDEQFLKDPNPKVVIPPFSCHSLRHTFTNRMVEASVNVKVLQETLGHKDITTTMNIYADVSKEFQKKEFEGAEKFFVDKPAPEPDTPDRAKIIRIV